MKISKVEKLLIFDSALIAGLFYYISQPKLEAALLFFIIFLTLEILVYYFAWKIWKGRKSRNSTH
jgi:hypothetical protein